MYVVDVKGGLDGAEHPLQRATSVLIGKGMPIALDATARPALGERGNKPGVPVEDRAPGVEGQNLDSLHCCPPQRTRAVGTMKLPAISLSRSSSLDRHASRNAWIAAPTAVSFQNQSPSWRLDGLAVPAAAASRQ